MSDVVAPRARPLAATKLRRARRDSDEVLAKLLHEVEQPESGAPCCRSGCDGRCKLKPGPGRPPRFCSNACRIQYFRERTKFLDELREYEILQDRRGLPADTRSLIAQRIKLLRMQLDRFRPFDSGDS